MCFMFKCSLELYNKVIHVSLDDNQSLFILYVYKQKQEPQSLFCAWVGVCVYVWVPV